MCDNEALCQPSAEARLPVAKEMVPGAVIDYILRSGTEREAKVELLQSWEDGVLLGGVLDDIECGDLIQATETSGSYSFWHPNGMGSDFRRADTVEMNSESFAETLWKRMQKFVPKFVKIEVDGRMHERGTEGLWKACSVNATLLFARYREGGHFSPHTDGYTIVDFNTRSLYSVLLYLNNCDEGGRTRFMKREARTIDEAGASVHNSHEQENGQFIKDCEGRFRWPEEEVVAVASVEKGTACVFKQDVPHEGEPVGTGREKYIIRTDIMYTRVEPMFTADKDMKAYALFREADLLEADGNAYEAMRKYRHACRLSPGLAEVYGL